MPIRVPPVLLAILAAPLLAACSGGEAKNADAKGGGPGGQRAPSVVVGEAQRQTFTDRIEAVGTANANEQASLTSPVTDKLLKVNFGDGAFVPRGAVIAELARAEEQASLAEAQARAREAQLQLDRLRQLADRGFATQARIDEQVAAVATARAQADAARAQLADRVVRAPFAGHLAIRRISPGAVVSANAPIATIVDYSRIKLDFTVPERLLATLKPGLPIEARADAFPGERFRGAVASIDPLLDPATRAVTVRALLPNPGLKLRPGMLLTIALEGRARDAVAVPELAVLGQGGQSYVFRVLPDDTAVRTAVTTGVRRDGVIEISSGLQPGARIVTDGTVKVRDGGKVRPAARQQARSAAGTAA